MSSRIESGRSTPMAAASSRASAASAPAIRGTSSCARRGSTVPSQEFRQDDPAARAERDRLTIVADQRGCPTAARDIARRASTLPCAARRTPEQAPYGIYHFAGAGEASWFEFASAIVDLAADRLGQTAADRTDPDTRISDARGPSADTRLDCSLVVRNSALRCGRGGKRSRTRSIAC